MSRPLIGLALGSGAGRGWTHIGILRGLNEAGVEPDLICGTSIGALVGGAHLSNNMKALETWARSLTKLRILRYLDFRVGGGGFIGGDRLNDLLGKSLGDSTFDDLPKPFMTVATDLSTGHEVWFSEGLLAQAIRASYALPGLFTPVKVNGQWLVDGALVNPVPVSVCRAMGAKLVIAADLSADVIGKHWKKAEERPSSNQEARAILAERRQAEKVAKASQGSLVKSLIGNIFGGGDNDEESHGLFSVMIASLNILQDRVGRSRLAGDPPDVSITPRVGHIGLLEFDRAEECIEEGQAAVERALPTLRDALAVLS